MDRQTQKTIDALIASKAVNTAIDLRGRTCLSIASSCGHIPTVKSILKAKARVDQRLKSGSTALIVAAQNGHVSILEVLIGARANVNIASKTGMTALIAACSAGSFRATKLLLDAKADPNLRTKKHGRVALHVIGGSRQVTMVQLLVENSARINMKDNDGNTPVRAAVDRSQDKVVRHLLENKANPSLPNKVNQTPLMAAAWGGQLASTRALLFFKADIGHTDKGGKKAATLASEHGRHSLAKLILEWPQHRRRILGRYLVCLLDNLSRSTEVSLLIMEYLNGDLEETGVSFAPGSPLEQLKLQYLDAEEERDRKGAGKRSSRVKGNNLIGDSQKVSKGSKKTIIGDYCDSEDENIYESSVESLTAAWD